MGDKWKKPKAKFDPKSEKIPKIGNRPPSDAETILWSFALFDTGIVFHDDQHPPDQFYDVAAELRAVEGLNWREIEKNSWRDHAVACTKLIREAQNRLVEIKQDDIPELWRLRFSGTRRIWGIRDGRIFKALWWDPLHAVCPSEKKHT